MYEVDQLKPRKLCGRDACDEIGWCGRLFGLRRCQESERFEHMTLMIHKANDSPMWSDASATFKLQQLIEPQQHAM